MSAEFVVMLHTRAKAHLASAPYGEALCGATSGNVPGRDYVTGEPVYWSHGGDRAPFEEHCPERICSKCRKAEA